ncbi:MAG: RNA polymerase sigma factor [Verrucomicrobiota bacterium]|jgi:RNA polymerase sigma-70 factor (ECF subfamily)
MNPTDFTDQALWFETEVQPHARALRSWLLVRFPTIPDVDDLVQDSFTRILKAKAKGPVGSSRALLFTIARNLALDAIRRQKVINFEPITDDTPSCVLIDDTNIIESISRQQELEILTHAIQSLPSRCRRVFTLRTAYGMTLSEIAQQLGVSLSTVEKSMALGTRLCAEYFASRR